MRRISNLLVILMLFGFLSEFGPFDRVTDNDTAGSGVTPQHSVHQVDSYNK